MLLYYLHAGHACAALLVKLHKYLRYVVMDRWSGDDCIGEVRPGPCFPPCVAESSGLPKTVGATCMCTAFDDHACM